MPSSITRCEAISDASHLGSWRPKVDEIVSALEGMPETCVPKSVRADAVRACAKRVGRSTVMLSMSLKTAEEGGADCDESILTAEWKSRRWVVAHAFFRYGSKFSGSVSTIELHDGKPVLFLENHGLVESCGRRSPPKGTAKEDWIMLPAHVQKFLCEWGG